MHKSTTQNEPGPSTARPKLARQQDSELLASYYQSPLADQGVNYSPHALQKRPTHRRSLSGNSTSSSDYSTSGTSDHSIEQVQPATRRSSIPSEGGADRRRLAIVQMDPTRLEGLALVAPPDAAGNLKEYISPPSSAPPTGSRSNPHPHSEDKGHGRSASEATSRTLKTKSSRDVGIVGTGLASFSPSAPLESSKMKLRLQTASESLLPPVFQEPHSSRASTPNTRASSPSGAATPSDARSLAPKRHSTDLSVHTPEIGQAKEIHVPVASPVVVDLGPDASLRVGRSSFDRRSTMVEPRSVSPLPLSSYLHYQPGLHATAGPLPPPPRATFTIDSSTPPPPRPPRLHSPPPRSPRRRDLDTGPQTLQGAVSAILSGSSGSSTPASTSRSISPPRVVELSSSEESKDDILHRREGAFSPSIISTTPSTSPSDYSPTTALPGRTIDGLIPTVGDASKVPVSVGGSSSKNNNIKENAGLPPIPPMLTPPPRMESLPELPNEEWTHISRDLTASPAPSSEGHVSMDHDRVSWDSYSPPASLSHSQDVTPSKTRARTSLGAGLKRFASLPRTPSPSGRSSRSLGRSSSTSTHRSAKSPRGSPAGQTSPLPPPSSWHASSNYSHSETHANLQQHIPRRNKIVSRNPPAMSSADIFGRKSALERCSLYAQKINELYEHDCGLSQWVVEARFRGSTGPKATTPGGGPQQRHVSRSSMKSEATFPLRADATVATDLSTKPSDIAPAVPSLPYPALSPRALNSTLPSASTMPMPLRMLASAASSSSNSSSSSKTSGNLSFFSSLGRKGSISKPSKPPPMASFSISSSSGGGTRLTKAPPISNPRLVMMSNSPLPAVPGGPRALPNRAGDRALRTQSINTAALSSNMADRSSAAKLAKRPSLFAPASSSSAGSRSSESPSRNGGRSSGSATPDREFEKQVDKLSDLLPQADRDVLAGYLRRAGQDILAIGQYLEDEKHGVLKRAESG
ncbi:hypothetical protein K438DRAFT_40965 [Mycena galopus ATCC 62051]|nr:hypothetical protein K438DRAFT_40965 [Mycena galopus ATCC 62051]